MLEKIREAIAKQVAVCFPDAVVYAEEVPQKGKLPCFSLHLTEVDMVRKIGRYQCTPKWKLCYHPKEEGYVRMDALVTGMQLLRRMELLQVDGEVVRVLQRHSVMQQERMEMTFHTPYLERGEEQEECMNKQTIRFEEEWK